MVADLEEKEWNWPGGGITMEVRNLEKIVFFFIASHLL
jgi:hypothetical protein